MPQMAPLNWIVLLIFSISIILALNSINYFLYPLKPQKINLNKKTILNWKW
nr:ATP synthase F0 subunit 8 [Wallacea dactyliferae]